MSDSAFSQLGVNAAAGAPVVMVASPAGHRGAFNYRSTAPIFWIAMLFLIFAFIYLTLTAFPPTFLKEVDECTKCCVLNTKWLYFLSWLVTFIVVLIFWALSRACGV